MSEEVKEELRESSGGLSMLGMYEGCARAWFFKYVRGWKEKGISTPLILGSVCHEATEVFYKEGFNYNRCMDRAIEVVNDLEPTLKNRALSQLHIWYQYIGKYEKDKVNVLAVEEPLEIKLLNGFIATGRMDQLLEDKETGEVFISDLKTTGWSLEATLRNYNYHPQPRLYYAGFEESFKATHPEWVDRCNGWRTSGVLCKERVSRGQKTGEFYGEGQRSSLVTFSQEQLDDVRISYSAHTDAIAYALGAYESGDLPASASFPACYKNCMAFNRLCPYYNECHKVDLDRSMPGNFIYDDWAKKGTVLNKFRALEAYKG